MNAGDFYTVFIYLNEAKYLFERDKSIKNSLVCEFKFANYYKRIGCKELAIETYNLFLIGFEQINLETFYYEQSHLQICDIYIQMNLYEKALDQLSNLSFDSNTYPNSFIYEIWILLNLKKISEAIKIIDQISKSDVELKHEEILELFRLIATKSSKKNNSKKLKKAINVFKHFYKTNDFELSNFYLNIVIDELNNQLLFEKLNKYNKIKIEMLNI